jgi:hypothetical protein
MSVYSRFPMLINPRIRCGFLLLLLLNQDLVIQIDLINKSIPHANNGQSHTYEEFNKISINQVKHHNMIITKVPILKY